MRPFTFAIAVVLAAACALQCSNSYDLADALPSCVPKEVQEIIAGDDQARLRAYVRQLGMMQAVGLYGIMDESYDFSSPENYDRSESVLTGPHGRVAGAIATEFRLFYYLDTYNAIASRPQEERRYLRSLMRECVELGAGDATPQAIAKVAQNLKHFEEQGFPYGAEIATRCLGGMNANAGNEEIFLICARRSLAMQRRLGHTRLLVQQLGEKGAMYAAQGHIDSMHACWDEALQLANEYRMPDQAPRLLNFYARFYRRQGQTALAHDMLRASVSLADEYGGATHRQRSIIELADFYKEFEHWDLAKRLVDRAEVVVAPDFCSTVNPDRLLTLRADILMGTGRVEDANRTYEQVWKSFSGATPLGGKALLLQGWAKGLVDNGEPKRALELIDQGLQYKTSARISLWLLRARASYDLRNLAECEEALNQFASLAGQEVISPLADWLVHDSLRIDVSMAKSDATHAWQHAAIALERLMVYLSRTDASVDGYLMAARTGRIRSSLHRLVADDPILGYGAALFWVESHRLLGTRNAVATDTSRKPDPRGWVEQAFRTAADRSRTPLARAGATHLVFAIVGNDVLRWTATTDGVAQEVLPVDAAALRLLISRACEELSPYAQVRHGSSRDKIDRLSQLLLPELASARTCILVTPDAWLGAFPFEVLNVSRAGYTPLLATHDVAYLRPGVASKAAPVVGPPLVFVSPEGQGDSTHRFPFQPVLQAPADEAAAVRSVLPGARLLSGERATSQSLLSSWKNSNLVYVIGHIVRDPEAPYMMMIPAASAGEDRSKDAYVEVADIRSTDLSRCELVVLSGCSSGLPYTGQGASAPSLAQACIDAGARSVVHTFWDIEDRQASELMTAFINKRSEGMSSVRALAEARRARMQLDGASNFHWASYGILIDSGELVQAVNGVSATGR